MSDVKDRGPSAYNTPYDEFPDDLSVFPPYMSLCLLEIILMILGGSILVSMVGYEFFPTKPWASLIGGVVLTIYISITNFRIIYGYANWVIPLQVLCVFYMVASIPHFFYGSLFSAFLTLLSGGISFWITGSDQFRLMMYHQVKLGRWRREQLEKNKIRREVIRERKAEARAKRKNN